MWHEMLHRDEMGQASSRGPEDSGNPAGASSSAALALDGFGLEDELFGRPQPVRAPACGSPKQVGAATLMVRYSGSCLG